MQISIDRIRMEIEKILLSPGAYEALKALEVIPGLPKANKHFHIYQKKAEGNLAFLWAAYINGDVPFYTPKNMLRLNLSTELVKEITFLLCSDGTNVNTSPYAAKLIEFRAAENLERLADWREKFGPFSSGKEKLKSMGIDGDLLLARGFSGKRIADKLNGFSYWITEYPETPVQWFLDKLDAEDELS